MTAYLWLVNLAEVEEDTTILDARERGRADRFVRASDRTRYVRSHVALRRILGRYLERPAGGIAFAPDETGKPGLAGAEVGFSLSHSGESALVGISPEPIGVDIELKRSELDFVGIARTRFSPEENGLISAAPNRDLAVDIFFRAWTRHEAAGKASGRGLSADASELAAFRAENIEAPPGYAAAVARPRDDRSALVFHSCPES